MKKVILSAVALMIGGFAFAQTTPDAPTQAVDIVALPGAPSSANTGESVQNGNNQKVSVIQIGTKQSAASYQEDGMGIGGNLARIKQTGNVGPTSGVANLAEVHQQGSTNQSTQWQEGDKNSSLVKQGMNNAASANNKALTIQGTGNQAEKNWAEINQDGDDNQARTKQTFDNSAALVNQNGDRNYADINQNGSPNNSAGHDAEIGQDGDDNDARIKQYGNGAANAATALQSGSGNFSSQDQDASASGGSGNNAYVAQGEDNRSNPMAFGLYTQLLGVDNVANGTFNPGASNATAFQFQDGDDNNAASLQFGDENYSEQNQDGDDNDALIVQNAFGNPNGESNYARQDQDGDNNESAIAQNGKNQRAYHTQIGNKNNALSTQRGHDNDVNIHQRGDRNRATTAQRGQCNDILVVQHDGQSYSVEQNLNGGLPGGNNTANIFQAGPGGGADIDCIINPELVPGAQTPVPSFNIADICPGC